MKAVTKVSIIDQVVSTIKESILNGEFTLGQKLPSELSLCKTLSVSRSTIREACRVLQTLGYVELKPGRGAFICDTDPHDVDVIRYWFSESASQLEDFTDVRKVLEQLAVRMAIEHCTDNDIQALERVNTAFIKAVNEHNISEVAKLDEAYHEQIFLMSRNLLLIKLNRLISIEFKKFRIMTFSLKRNCLNAVDPHAKVLDAIKRRNIPDGITEMSKHMDNVMIDIKKTARE